jgi:hypothetical protein
MTNNEQIEAAAKLTEIAEAGRIAALIVETVPGSGNFHIHNVGVSPLNDKGENGFRTGYTANGDSVEWLPDEEEITGEDFPMITPRNRAEVLKEYEEHREKVWWNRHQVRLERIESGEEVITEERKEIFRTARKAARRIERKYGKRNLGWDDLEWGLLQGKMMALIWVLGAEWDEAGDT